ncbi:exported hypothetical protein [Candidatus Zixiibacteriota bacterium]|nr:exported hypothetical protein [candidate division Zixibacteria bacterium]
MKFVKMTGILFFLMVSTSYAESAIELVPDSINFGIVPAKSNFYQKVILKSVGTDTLVIDSINPVCDCIKMPLDKTILPPGDSTVFEVSYASEEIVGERNRWPYIYYNRINEAKRLPIRAFMVSNLSALRPIYVTPFRIMASQFGDAKVTEFPFFIVNETSDTIPLRLLYTDNEYYSLDFPVFVPAKSRAEGKIILNEKGLESEFEKSFTFEFINSRSEAKNYSVPVIRKIYKK